MDRVCLRPLHPSLGSTGPKAEALSESNPSHVQRDTLLFLSLDSTSFKLLSVGTFKVPTVVMGETGDRLCSHRALSNPVIP